jgi:SAM-dependent methyltransferase
MIALGGRSVLHVQSREMQVAFGLSIPPMGDYHEKLLETVHNAIKNYHEQSPFLFLEIGGGGGDAAADIAAMIGNYQNRSKNFKGKVLVSEPLLPKVANEYIHDFLKIAGIQGIKDLYKVSSRPFPECAERGNKIFDIIHCKNVIHFLPPKVMDPFFDRMFQSVKPGGYVFLAANAPSQVIYPSGQVSKEWVDALIGYKKDQIGERISSLDYYKNWEGKKAYPGYCTNLDFYYCSRYRQDWLRHGDCLTSYPFDYEKVQQYARPEHAVLRSDADAYIESVRSIKNLFTVQQLESIGEKYGTKIIESGYLKGEGTEENPKEVKLARNIHLSEHPPLSAYIILQRPVT